MSYFSCDIPYMSDEELKKTGIHIPKKRITNREKLAKMSNDELAEFICCYSICFNCIGKKYCVWGAGHGNGILTWLESEADEDNG